ncbi:MAG: hypothetical protein IJA72_02065, partial [Clostridia bacterium]|nr:hypothetical protein [Clostridia bacterium]
MKVYVVELTGFKPLRPSGFRLWRRLAVTRYFGKFFPKLSTAAESTLSLHHPQDALSVLSQRATL